MKNKKIDVRGLLFRGCDASFETTLSYIRNTGLRKDELLSIKKDADSNKIQK